MTIDFVKPECISLRSHPQLNERWVQGLIAADPSMLGLGDLVLRDRERTQPRAGRLDLLLQDVETRRRYEVEIQLGPTDEAHIVRTIEYWDIERRRYPQYDHCAVLVAEDITSRFLNVVSLFNGAVPLVAVQMQAMRVGQHTTLVFTTVVDELTRGLVDEDEDAEAAPTDRNYWEQRAEKGIVALVDDLLEALRKFDPGYSLTYNKFYIGLSKQGQPNNFAIFKPKKKFLSLHLRLPQSSEIDAAIDNAGIDKMDYEIKRSRYRLRLTRNDIVSKMSVLTDLMRLADERATS